MGHSQNLWQYLASHLLRWKQRQHCTGKCSHRSLKQWCHFQCIKLTEEAVDQGEEAVEPRHDYSIFQTQGYLLRSGPDTHQSNVVPCSSNRGCPYNQDHGSTGSQYGWWAGGRVLLTGSATGKGLQPSADWLVGAHVASDSHLLGGAGYQSGAGGGGRFWWECMHCTVGSNCCCKDDEATIDV